MNSSQYQFYRWSFLLLISLVVSTSCSRDEFAYESHPGDAEILEEGEHFTVTMGLGADNVVVRNLRAGNGVVEKLSDIASLRLLVFDENGMFLYSRQAVLAEEEGVGAKPDEDFLPQKKRYGIDRVKKFTATLLKSNKKRRIHFVANYNWGSFEQDYFITGLSESSLIPILQTTAPNYSALWSYLDLLSLGEATLKDKVVVMLRNHAEIMLDTSNVQPRGSETTGTLQVEGYTVCHYPKKGTVAPFVYEASHSYSFPFGDIQQPTVLPDVELISGKQSEDFISADKPFPLYEWHNKDHKTCVIIRGKRIKNGTTLENRYYKIDLVTHKEDGTKVFPPILRNHRYKIVIKQVLSDGYDTYEKALASPAGNNVFASVELEDYPSVSDGITRLTVSPIVSYVVRDNTSLDFKVETNLQPSTNVSYIQEWKSGDPYVKDLVRTNDGFKVETQKLPTNGEHKEYRVHVVAKGTDGRSITRTARFTLRPPFKFEASLQSQSNGKRLTFKLDSHILPSVLPFDVLIEATNLTPKNNDSNNKLLLEFREQKIYYRYTVKDPAKLGQTVSLDFTENKTGETSSLALNSVYHESQTVH
ncbi:MAG: hypothetical protein SPI72_02415 [Porphyromonas sp.]|nr:hypothetical protein [Porphyromonas sp.]